MTMKVPIIGKVEMITTTVITDGLIHQKEESKVDRFIFRWMSGSEGSLTDISKAYKIFYDDEDEEQWQRTFEELMEEEVNPDTVGSKSITFTIGTEDDEESESGSIVSRTDEGMEDVHGINAHKWVTTILGDDNRIIFEEWMAEGLQQRTRALEFAHQINMAVGLAPEESPFSGFTNLMASSEETDLEPISGVMIRMNMIAFENDDDEPKMSISYELLNIIEEPFDSRDFDVPTGYRLVEKE